MDSKRRATIVGTGLYAPERVVPNSYFDELYGEDVDSFLRENRNIEERRYAAEDQVTSDLAAEAARDAMDDAAIEPADVDLLLVSTDTPDQISPSTAAVVQDKLEARSAATFDINTACAGFVTALDTGRKFLEADEHYDRVLVIGAYLMSRFIDYDQKNVASLFADGAGAAVLAPTTGEDGILTSTLVSKGEYHDYMGVYEGGTACPITAENGETQRLAFRKDFPEDFNPDHWTDLVTTLTDRLGVTPEDVDRYFFTQINVLSIRETLDRLDLPHDRAHNVMDRFGYTGNACVAMALADAADEGLLSPGDLVVMIASGGGAALAGMAFRWGDA
jgi:3-oxoacyl-[acyl-carrier-protein] synthase-3